MVLNDESVKKKLEEIIARQKKDQIAQPDHLSTATIAGSAGGNTAAGTVGMQHLPASALQKEELERTKRFVRYRGEDLHNTWTEGNERAQARQAANLAVPTTQSVLGWWTATAKNRQPSGLNTCRVYQTQKNGQTSFIENEVKPHHKHLLSSVAQAFLYNSPSFHDTAPHSPFSQSQATIKMAGDVTSQLSSMSMTSKPNSVPLSPAIKSCPGPEVRPEMTSRQRVQAMDWRCFGQRNHVTILRGRHFDMQYENADTLKGRLSTTGSSFARSQTRSLRELAKCPRRSNTTMGFDSADSFSRRANVQSEEPQTMSRSQVEEAQLKRDFLNLGRGGQRSGWDSQSMLVYVKSRNASPEHSPMASPGARTSPVASIVHGERGDNQHIRRSSTYQTAGKLSAQGSPLQISSPLISNAGDSGDVGAPISVSQIFGLRPPTEMGRRARGQYPNRSSSKVFSTPPVSRGGGLSIGGLAGGETLPKHFYIGQLLRDSNKNRAFK